MRIDRLDLCRYGRFTDVALQFAAAPAKRPDLHIVYGDNEAGKTTTLNAMLDLLFGIEANTPYKFLHQAAALRLGGALDMESGRHDVVRLPKSALLDVNERPLPEGVFSQEFAGLDRTTYKMMFSMDEKTLASGGESILASQGDLGQLLFSATAGLADFGQALSDLRIETEAFYKAHGRKHDLGELKKTLATLKERRAAIDIMAVPFARLIAERDGAKANYEEAVTERGRLAHELEAARRQLTALPRLAEWRVLQADHDALPDVPRVPRGWPEELNDLQKSRVALGERRATTEEEIARVKADIGALPVDEAGLSVAERVKRSPELRARDATAAKDLPERRIALRAAEKAVADILLDLGQSGCAAPRQLILRPNIIRQLQKGLERLAGASAALSEANSELDDAESRRATAHAAADHANLIAEDAPSFVSMRAAMAMTEADDSRTRLRLAERNCRVHGEALAERLRNLAPWQGDGDALAGLDVPERPERECLGQTLAEALSRRDHWRREADRLADEEHRLHETREALHADIALIDDDAAKASRQIRDDAWFLHHASLDAHSAQNFEAALQADDALIAARFTQASALSELRAVTRSLRVAAASRQQAERRLNEASQDLAQAQEQARARMIAFVGPDCETPLESFDAFVLRRERALDAREQLRSAEADRSQAMNDAAETRERLAAALEGVGMQIASDAPCDVLLAAGRSFLEGQSAARSLHERIEDASRDVAERRRKAQHAERGLESWREAWADALRPTWLAGTPEVGRVREALNALTELGPALDVRDGLADRIAKMEADRAAFAEETLQLADLLGIDSRVDVDDLADTIAMRAQTAVQNAATRTDKIDGLEQAEGRLRELRPAIEGVERRCREMTSRFAVGSLDDLALAFDASRRREELGERLRALEIEICSACNVVDVERADAALRSVDRDALEARRVELEARLEGQVERTQELFAALGKARDAVDAIDGDEAAARLEEERRTLLLEIEERTMAHLTMRAGIIAAEGAISLYRDRHRSSMLQRASSLFATLSCGAYRGLAAQSAKGGEVLVGLTAEGGSKLSTEMSTATRNQLYLALRIAAYQEFVKTRRPLPFVLDDVLETFDDDRAAASLAALADLSKLGQVIYLTHHRHLCAIASRVCPEASVHDLGVVGCRIAA